jgi:hypothetical protein
MHTESGDCKEGLSALRTHLCILCNDEERGAISLYSHTQAVGAMAFSYAENESKNTRAGPKKNTLVNELRLANIFPKSNGRVTYGSQG